jgi:outer membrane protein insertion porin family
VAKLYSGLSFGWCANILLLMVLWLAHPASATTDESAPQSLVVDIRIAVIDDTGDKRYWSQMVEQLTSSFIHRGEPLSVSAVESLSTALKNCKQFQAIHLDTEETPTGLIFMIAVTPFKRIKDIRVHGKYPLFEKQVLKSMTLYPGDAFDPSEVEKQSQLIAILYRQNGYVDTRVAVVHRQDPADGHYFMDLYIDKGRPYRLRRLTISGNQALQKESIRWKLKSVRWDNARFVEKNFQEDLKKLRADYLRRGYADVKISSDIASNAKSGHVDIHIQINEGPLYEIQFSGNSAFGEGVLKKDVMIFNPDRTINSRLRKSLGNLRERYRKAGFAEAKIQMESESATKADGDGIWIRFDIQEGPRTIVRSIKISGNSLFDAKTIKKQMRTRLPGLWHAGPYVPSLLDEDILAIEQHYGNEGYLNVSVQKQIRLSADMHHADISLIIYEGFQTHVTQVAFNGLPDIEKTGIPNTIQLKAGSPFNPSRLKADEKRVAKMISELGYPLVSVTGEYLLNGDGSEALVIFNITLNRYLKRGQTYYAGNFRTKDRILERELEMKPGDPFSIQKLVQAQQNMRQMNIFRTVTFNPVGMKTDADTIHLFAEVEEEKPFYFEASGGYASEKGLYATSRLGDHNFMGLNKDARVGAEVSETGHREEARIFEPRFLGTRISSDLSVYVERSEPFNQTFGTESLGSDLVFSRKWKKRFKASLGFHYERRDLFSRDYGEDEDETFDSRAIVMLRPSVSYDSRDNFLNPKKGLFCLTGIDISQGVENSLDDFFKFQTDLRGYTTPIQGLTLAGRGSFGKIEPANSQSNIPDDQLFFLGGASTVRGFRENLLLFDADGDPVGGRQNAVGNLEARIDLGSNIEFSLFYDIGYLDENDQQAEPQNVRHSTGAGLRYVTPAGAFGLVYGHNLDPEPDEDADQIHFSIGYTF